MITALRTRIYSANPVPINYVVVAGDSIPAGSGTTAGRSWPDRLTGSMLQGNIAIPGQTMLEILTNAPSKEALMMKYRNNILLISAGLNDINIGRTAAQIYANLQSYCALMRPLCQAIIVFTITTFASFDATQEQYRLDYNTMIIGGVGLQCNAVVQAGEIPGLQDPNGPNYAADHKHPNNDGAQLIANAGNLVIPAFLQ